MKNKALLVFGGIFAVIGIFALGYMLMFAGGKVQSKYNNTVGIEVKDSERNMYEHSSTYVQAKVEELAKERLELTRTKDTASRKAIIEYLISDCANLDIKDINDASIRQFLTQIRNGELTEGGTK